MVPHLKAWNTLLMRTSKPNVPCLSATFLFLIFKIYFIRVTDIKGDVILLNPHVPSIELSKVALSYSLGRAAKLTSIEKSLEECLTTIDAILFGKEKNLLSMLRPSTTQLLRIRQRMMKGSRDGFLGTSEFHWAKPELQGSNHRKARKKSSYAVILI